MTMRRVKGGLVQAVRVARGAQWHGFRCAC